MRDFVGRILVRGQKSVLEPYFWVALGFGIGAVGVTLFLVSFLWSANENGLCYDSWCFTGDCIKTFLNEYRYSFWLLEFAAMLIAAEVALGGIVISLASYRQSVKVNNFSNHISNFNTFLNYLDHEIAKRKTLSKESFDAIYWYNEVFPESKLGCLDVGESYRQSVLSIRKCMSDSNRLYAGGKNAEYRYKAHQKRIVESLKSFGIRINDGPRIGFYEKEDEVVELIAHVNRNFCFRADLPKLPVRKYH